MSSEIKQRNNPLVNTVPTTIWLRWLIITVTILGWLILVGIGLWILRHVTQAVVLLLLGVTIATVVAPLVRWLSHRMPRPLAIAIVYTVVLCGVGSLLYFIINIVISQLLSLIQNIVSLTNENSPLMHSLQRFGININLRSLGQQIVGQLRNIVNNLLLIVSDLFTFGLNFILMVLLSIYFLSRGPCINDWLRHNTPLALRRQTNFLLNTCNRVIGKNFRGVLLLATIISIITGIGLYFIGVPYPLLISILAFFLEFIPIVGFYVTAIVILLAALTKGWIIGLIALAFVSVLRSIEGDILAPRVLGDAVGISPILSIAAIIVGIDLFGILGAFFAMPAAGAAQAIIEALWHQWKEHHPEQFAQASGVENQVKQDF